MPTFSNAGCEYSYTFANYSKHIFLSCIETHYQGSYSWKTNKQYDLGSFLANEYIPQSLLDSKETKRIQCDFGDFFTRRCSDEPVPYINSDLGIVMYDKEQKKIVVKRFRKEPLWFKENGQSLKLGRSCGRYSGCFENDPLDSALTDVEPKPNQRWDYATNEWSYDPVGTALSYKYVEYHYRCPNAGRLWDDQKCGYSKITKNHPPHHSLISEGYVGIYNEDVTASNDGYWSIEKDYKDIPLWNTLTGQPIVKGVAVWNKKCGDMPEYCASAERYKHVNYWFWFGKLPFFITDKERLPGQYWDYSINNWSFNPIQQEPLSNLGDYDLSEYELPSSLSLILSSALKQIDANAERINEIKSRVVTGVDTGKIEALENRIEAVETKEGENANAIISLDGTLGELTTKTTEYLTRIVALEEQKPPEIIIPDNIVTIEQEGEVRLDQFALEDKKYVYSFPDGIAIDDAVFYRSEGLRGSINIHITYKAAHNRYNIWFFQKAFNKLKRKYEDFNEADCFVRWQTQGY